MNRLFELFQDLLWFKEERLRLERERAELQQEESRLEEGRRKLIEQELRLLSAPPRIRIAPAMRMDWQGYRQEPQRFADARPEPHELGPYGHCWWWPAMGRSWIRCHVDNLEPDDLWLPYQAIADPGARP